MYFINKNFMIFIDHIFFSILTGRLDNLENDHYMKKLLQ
jgi:hypothetical protein